MTSETTEVVSASPAQTNLEYALGEHRVHLTDLSPEEFTRLLRVRLGSASLDELRGFSRLRDVVSSRGDDPIGVTNYTAFMLLRREDQTSDEEFASDVERINLNVQAVKVCREVCFQSITYSRLESGESTTSAQVAREWGRDAYISAGLERVLVLIRPTKHSYLDQNLIEVEYGYRKVLHERRYSIDTVTAVRVPINSFRDHFANKAPQVARDLIWEIRSLHIRTLDELKTQANRMSMQTDAWNRLAESIA